MVGSEVYLDREAAVTPAASFIHIGACHFSDRTALFDERQHVRFALHNELTKPDDTQHETTNCDDRMIYFLTQTSSYTLSLGVRCFGRERFCKLSSSFKFGGMWQSCLAPAFENKLLHTRRIFEYENGKPLSLVRAP